MKQIILAISLLFSQAAYPAKYIQGHTNKNGTYTQGHFKSEPNSKRYDNLNSKTTQTNPYTGKRGQQRDEFSNPPANNQGRQKN